MVFHFCQSDLERIREIWGERGVGGVKKNSGRGRPEKGGKNHKARGKKYKTEK